MTGSTPSDKPTIGTVERTAEVLLLFTRVDSESLGVTEIAGGLGISKAVVHRILTSLRSSGLIHLDQLTRRYSLGPAALALGNAYLSRMDIRELAREPMRRLVERTRETATLSIRTERARVYLDQVTPNREVKMTVPLGQQFPLHLGGSSKVFLAFLADADRDAYLTGLRSPAGAREPPPDPAQLRRQLDEIRQRGYAVSFGDRQEGAGSVAAPIFDRDGAVAAVMSVCGPAERFRAAVGQVSALLLMEASALSRRLGYPLA